MSVVRSTGNLSHSGPSSAACALPHSASVASRSAISFFIWIPGLLDSMGVVRHALRDGLELAHAAPDRHEQEEAEVQHRAQLRDVLTDRRRRLDAEVAEDDEVDDEDAVEDAMPARAVADRLDRAVVEPGQEEQDDDRTTHHHH